MFRIRAVSQVGPTTLEGVVGGSLVIIYNYMMITICYDDKPVHHVVTAHDVLAIADDERILNYMGCRYPARHRPNRSHGFDDIFAHDV